MPVMPPAVPHVGRHILEHLPGKREWECVVCSDRTRGICKRSSFWCPGCDDVKRWVERCERCAIYKMPQVKTKTPMGRLSATRPLEVLAIDFTMLEP